MRTVIPSMTADAPGLNDLIEHLHRAREKDRTSLARELHDEVGTMLAASAMELGWLEGCSLNPEINEHLRRLGGHLADMIRINRRSIEVLRPTLLDTFGLFEALRWSFKEACQRVDAHCVALLPDDEAPLDAHQLTHLFRATQTLLECTLFEGDLKTMKLEAVIVSNTLAIRLEHEHCSLEPSTVLSRFGLELTSAAQRIASLGGELVFESYDHGAHYAIRVPLDRDAA